MSHSVIILALTGSANMAVATPLDMLFACNRIARSFNSSAVPRFLVQTMAEGACVKSNSGADIQANLPLTRVNEDAIVIVASRILST